METSGTRRKRGPSARGGGEPQARGGPAPGRDESRCGIAERRRSERARRREDEERRQAVESELRLSRDQLRALSARLEQVREDERTRVAREIHDELGQALTAIKLDVSWLAERPPLAGRALRRALGEVADRVDATIGAVRRIATELRPAALDSLGLETALREQARDLEEKSGVALSLGARIREGQIRPELATAAFRICQEALTNVVRHAGARHVWVVLDEEPGWLAVSVRDDGCGITPEERSDPASLGILGMRERARMLGGRLHVSGVPGKGTTVSLRLPLADPHEARP